MDAEVDTFWLSEKISDEPFQQKLDEVADEGLNLPEDILPEFDTGLGVTSLLLDDKHVQKKQKKWGPVQPIRQSSRIDRSKNIMEKAQELKKITNLEAPRMKGVETGPFFPKGLESSFQRARRGKDKSVHGLSPHQAEKTSLSAGSLTCTDFGWLTSWQSSADAAAHGGRATLEYLKAHPDEDSSVHVVM